MNKHIRQVAACFAAGAASLLAAPGAWAQVEEVEMAYRTWVSGVGDDANPCSRTAPCKTWQGTITHTMPGGTITALDSGGFGAVTITKPVTIDGAAVLASALATNTNAFIISGLTANDLVVLRNVHADGTTAAANTAGVSVRSPARVIVENANLQRFGAGIEVQAAATGAQVDVRNVTITGNTFGVRNAGPGSSVVVVRSSIRGNGTGAAATAGSVQLQGSKVTHNTVAFSAAAPGVVDSYGDNMVDGNGSIGSAPGNRPKN